MKDILYKLFHPHRVIAFLLFNLSVVLLIYVFSYHLEETLIAYITYPLSAYSFTIFCIWFYKACKFGNTYVKEKSRAYKFYNNNLEKITKINLYRSLAFNLIYGLFKLFTGIYYKSIWFITFAIYYLLLSIMKTSLVRGVTNNDFGKNKVIEYKKQRNTGIILLFLDIVLSGIIILIIHQNQVVKYSGYLIYLVALYDFYLIISAIINIFKYKHSNSPIISASKCINLTVAMISIISLEVAMIYEFGNNDSNFKLIMTSCTGFGVALINSFMSIYMIVSANNKLKKCNEEFTI
jgi:hypothetical protein